ncbi:MAG: iron-containing alcohol dehydrogenase [Gracilimonas sp.]
MNFEYRSYPNKIIFGTPILDALEQETDQPKKIFVIGSSRYNELIDEIRSLPNIEVIHHFEDVIQHVPKSSVDEAIGFLKNFGADIILAIGGGSAVGLAKGMVLQQPLPIWSVTTTYSGSEVTNIYGVSTDGKKDVGRNDVVMPEKVFYDPALSISLPLSLASTSATNALAHLVEAVYSHKINPVTYELSMLGIKHLLKGIRSLAEKQKLTEETNEDLLFGAYLAGKSLCEVTMGLHHKTAHVLGGNFGMEHSAVHTVILSYALAYQWEYLSDDLKTDLKRIFDSKNPPASLKKMIEAMGAESTLKNIGFNKNDIPEAAKQICAIEFESPAPIEPAGIESMLEKAFNGKI